MKKRWLAGVLLLTMLLAPANIVRADSTQVTPYVTLGADLKDSERATVLKLLELNESDLANYEVREVTNAEEHQFLDEYLSKSVIGTRALSSVRVEKGEDGSGIHVTTKNITYCSSGMYTNALTTAGVTDADVVVAGPFHISGTAALVGAMKAYEVMTGEEITKENADAANNELVVTGDLGQTVGSDKASQFVAAVKEDVLTNNLSSKEDLEAAVDKAAKSVGITVTPAQKASMVELMGKITNLDIDVDTLKAQAKGVYDQLVGMGVSVEKAQGFFEGIGKFFSDAGKSIGDFFSNLFS